MLIFEAGAYKRGSYQRQFTVINLFLSRKYRKKSLGYTSEIVHATEIQRWRMSGILYLNTSPRIQRHTTARIGRRQMHVSMSICSTNCNDSVFITPRVVKANEANVIITRNIMVNGRYNQHGPFSCTHNGLILFKHLKDNRNENYFLSVPAYLPIWMS